MVQTIKSVLLIDYDSIHRSLSETEPGTGELLGTRAGVWLEAIEGGDIVHAPYLDPDVRRRFQTKRCYADPKLLGKNRGWLTANGVQIVDCTPSGGLSRGAADIHMTLDALDAAESEPDEIIVLSAETDLTPLLFRLRALNQKVLIYVTDQTAVSYRTFADGSVDGERLAEILAQPTEMPLSSPQGAIPRPPRMSAPAKPERFASQQAAAVSSTSTGSVRPSARPAKSSSAGAATQPIDREALASLVRRIHEATNVPLFSPRAFAELFRLIARDVAEHGYKFSGTTDRVTEGMNKLGRNVSKRQVGFVVKGLTLRGHVFSKDDTPEELASIFYEQVLYLVESTDFDLTDVETGLVQAWLGGFGEPSPQPRSTEPRERTGTRRTEPASVRPADGAVLGDRRASPKRPLKATAPSSSGGAPPTPTDDIEEDPVRERAGGPMRTASRPMRVVEEDRTTEPTAEPSFARRVGRNGAAAASPRSRPPPETPAEDVLRDAELEDSILSAIADAVDVLAVDSPPTPPVPGARSSMSPRRAAPIAPEVEPPRDGDSDADEIGDEIQRILASYSEDR